jgi:DNA-binding NarL/FixJ family response regulator
VIRLDSVTNLNILKSDLFFTRRQKSLYFKYLTSIQEDFSKYKFMSGSKLAGVKVIGNISLQPDTINSSGRRILLIDDEGYRGWEVVLKNLFKGAHFEAVKSKDVGFEDFILDTQIKIQQDWDLILLDLRLNKELEDLKGKVLSISEYSGAKILEQIKKRNKGAQVIMFTASNKIWNMKGLMKTGADGYYLKESPEFSFTKKMTELNYIDFKANVKRCFDRDYLRIIYSKNQNINGLSSENEVLSSFIETQLESSFVLLNLDLINFSYLNYFQIIEYYIQKEYDHKNNSIIADNGDLYLIEGEEIKLTFCDGRIKHFKKIASIYGNENITTLAQLSFLLAYRFSYSDDSLERVGELVKKRNKVAHNGNGNIVAQDIIDVIAIIEIFKSSSNPSKYSD